MQAKIAGLGLVAPGGVYKKEHLFDHCINLNSLPLQDSLFRTTSEDFLNLSQRLLSPIQDLKSRCGVFSALALQSALEDAEWRATDLSDCGFIFASTTSQIDLWEKTLPHYLKNNCDRQTIKTSLAFQSLATPAVLLSKRLSIGGPLLHVASSCSASLQAIALAAMWIKAKKVQRCIVGSTEIHSQLTEVGFSSLRLLSKSNSTPFDKNRKGINLGEASAFICLEASDLRTGDSRWGYVNGSGLTTDAFHPTSPHPQGNGSEKALCKALIDSSLKAEDIDWIYAHGTGSIANDLSESLALEKVFGTQTPVTSTKPIHGHTLAASGALESILGIMAMKRNVILPTPGLLQQDPAIHIHVATQPLEKQINFFVKNSLGFGGINAAVVFSKEPGL